MILTLPIIPPPPRPVVVSHTGVAALCPGTRTLSDELVKAVAANGARARILIYSFHTFPPLTPPPSPPQGVMGVGFWSEATCGSTTSAIGDTMDYIARLVGPAHVALGSDWDGVVAVPPGLDASGVGQVTQALIERGWRGDDLAKMMGGNVLRVLLSALTPGRAMPPSEEEALLVEADAAAAAAAQAVAAAEGAAAAAAEAAATAEAAAAEEAARSAEVAAVAAPAEVAAESVGEVGDAVGAWQHEVAPQPAEEPTVFHAQPVEEPAAEPAPAAAQYSYEAASEAAPVAADAAAEGEVHTEDVAPADAIPQFAYEAAAEPAPAAAFEYAQEMASEATAASEAAPTIAASLSETQPVDEHAYAQHNGAHVQGDL